MPRYKVDYSKQEVSEDYICSECGVKGVKLWRNYQSTRIILLCASCAAKYQHVDISSMDEKGLYLGKFSITDQIGWYAPAVPCQVLDTFWGYTSIPDEGAIWWQNLPNKLDERDLDKIKVVVEDDEI
jgi:hypothetical protein